ncbi:MAG TPA: carboxypeptidase regulatory-like domain-containing protein [Saprospiraceae bacterium]|nr:carboxypeptidase regulatory-like domain-containing protein [Saprospiraceae bacterium]
MRHLLLLLIFCWPFLLFGQTRATITGRVTDAFSEEPIELVTIFLKDSTETFFTETARNGRYRIDIPANQPLRIGFSRIGYKESFVDVAPMPGGSLRQLDLILAPQESDLEVEVRASKLLNDGAIREDVEQLKVLPTTTGNLESLLPHIALGASSGTGGELSSQYNVRGGNYDENLVYVNDFQIYRPQLIRAGQQEGLTFPNIDLISSLSFSSGGFEARYGDKMSSVLDIKYKRPDSTRASVGGSLLGGSAHLEGSIDIGKDDYQKLRYLFGARYKTTRYLLGSLDVQGEYTPNFADIQTYITYDITRDLQLGFLGNYNRSVYNFVPTERNTGFGLVNFALQLFSVFEGQEKDNFTTAMGGLSLTYIPDRKRNPLFLKLLGSTNRSDENEAFDIIGNYSLRQIDSNLGSGDFGEVVAELGTGTQQEYVRNFLNATVTNLEHRGGIELQQAHSNIDVTSSHFLQWSAKYQRELIDDSINEWERLDSAGYSLPFDPASVQLFSVLKTSSSLSSNRLQAFFQDTYTYRNNAKGEWRISAGARLNYWDLNQELIISPRAQLLYKPLRGFRDVSYRLAGGLYAQPPFYREMRRPDGTVNTDLKAQKSAHIVGGMTLDFYLGKRNPKKFRFITEAYYKSLWDLVSYEIENVRIRYSGENDATGYVAGVDFRLNGEFVPDAESWINLSFLQARESLTDIQHLRREIGQQEASEVDFVARPTDQFMTLAIFFQDYFKDNKNFKMHLNLTVGTGLPFGLRGNNRIYRNTYRFDPYHRVDIGFSLLLWDEEKRKQKPDHFLNITRRTWLSLEVFNLMQVQNQAGNTWIKTVFQQQYAIPNYLTSRRINLRVKLDF